MRIRSSFIVFAFISFYTGLFVCSDAFAAAAMQRRVQQQKMQQEQMMQQAYQQAVAQKQAQEAAAYQQAVAQRQAVMQQQAYQKASMEYAAYKQAMQQAVAKRNAELQAAEQMKQVIVQRQQQVAEYQTAVARKQMSEVVAYKQGMAMKQAVEQKAQAEVNGQIREYAQYLSVRKAALAEQGVMMQHAVEGQKLIQHTAVQHVKNQQARFAAEQKIAAGSVAARSAMGQKMAAEVMASQAPAPAEEASPSDQADTVVGIEDLWKALDVSSASWAQIVDKEIKLLTVSEYIDRFRQRKIKIRKSPGYYVGLIDAFGDQMEGFLSAPFANVLSYAAIVDYDFDNGEDKDALARQVLGAEQFESNRKRILGR
jgi:hypothetical protein